MALNANEKAVLVEILRKAFEGKKSQDKASIRWSIEGNKAKIEYYFTGSGSQEHVIKSKLVDLNRMESRSARIDAIKSVANGLQSSEVLSFLAAARTAYLAILQAEQDVLDDAIANGVFS